MMQVRNEKAAPAATGTAESSGNYHDSQASTKYMEAVANYHRYLNFLRDIHMGVIPEPTGFYWGDGVPRTAGGYPFKPLDWGGLLRI